LTRALFIGILLAVAASAQDNDASARVKLLQQAVQDNPESAEAHNNLGMALFQTGDAKAAVGEFRAAEKLAPADPNVHFNLGEALARTGSSEGAVEELRRAVSLAPGDADLARLLDSVEGRLAASGSTIKVDVRQVLVPVVVTDPQGHRMTGLKQADFQVFEDGVEQKITSFSMESSGLPAPAAQVDAAGPATAAAVSAAPSPPKPRRTYMIVIDTLHTPFLDLAPAREALVKFFQQERPGDSQYVVIALGVSPEMVCNVTSSPAEVLAALDGKRFLKIYLDGQLGGIAADMERFRRELNDVRAACDQAPNAGTMSVQCGSGLLRVAERTRQLAESERNLTAGFLQQFRSLVSQLAKDHDRRTIILVSSGFQIDPGREAAELFNAFFPAASHCFVPSNVMCPHNGLEFTGRMAAEFEPILRIAAASNVTIDTLDSRGLYGQQAFDASQGGTSVRVDRAVGRAERDVASAAGNTLVEIAASTGGTAFHDNNNLLGGLQRAFADGRDYYMLGYVSGNANLDGKFRAITVQVRDRKAVANAKKGYWAGQPPTAQ
jgi:VWFA-related protein